MDWSRSNQSVSIWSIFSPGADFRGYTKVMVEPTEVAFAKNWQRDYNRASRALSGRVSDRDVEEAVSEGVKAAHDIFTAAWTKGGYAVVTEPGPDVLRVKTGIINITVNAPDQPTSARSYSFSDEAGSATLFVEARDSMTGALLGRAIDQGIVGDNNAAWRTASSNRADFREMVENWAQISVRGMTELKSLPVTPALNRSKPRDRVLGVTLLLSRPDGKLFWRCAAISSGWKWTSRRLPVA